MAGRRSGQHDAPPDAANRQEMARAQQADPEMTVDGSGAESAGHLSKREFEYLAELRHALRRFARQTELEARRRGISPQQYALMLAIKGFPGRERANITELAERLQVRHNAVIGLVNRAEEHGLVARVQDAERGDRRVVLVRLTDRGERVLQAMAEAMRSERARVRIAVEAANQLGRDSEAR